MGTDIFRECISWIATAYHEELAEAKKCLLNGNIIEAKKISALFIKNNLYYSLDGYDAELKYKVKDFDALLMRGCCYFYLGNYKKALKDFRNFTDRKSSIYSEKRLYFLFLNIICCFKLNLEEDIKKYCETFFKNSNNFNDEIIVAMKKKLDAIIHGTSVDEIYDEIKSTFDNSVANGSNYDECDVDELKYDNYNSVESDDRSYVDEKNRAFELHKEGKFEKARAIYQRIIKNVYDNSEIADLEYSIAECYDAEEKYFDALSHVNKAIKYVSDDGWHYQLRGNIFYRLKKYSQAIKDLKKAITLGREDTACVYLGRVYYANASNNSDIDDILGDLKKALHYFKKAERFGYIFSSDYYSYGSCLQFLGFLDEAEELANKRIAVENNPLIIEDWKNKLAEIEQERKSNNTVIGQKQCHDSNYVLYDEYESDSSEKNVLSASDDEDLDGEEISLPELMDELNNLIGLDNVKNEVNTLINLLRVNKVRAERGMKQVPTSKHLVFSGNPGTGKTTVARILAKIYKALGVLSKGQLIEVDRSKLVAGYVGQTAIQTQEIIQQAMGGILFIDEAYTLSSSKGSNDFGQEAIDTILKAMEDNRDDFVVIVAGYPDLMQEFLDSNPGLRSRFNKFINFDDYSPDELTAIFNVLCEKSGYAIDDEIDGYLHDYFEEKYNNRDRNFANGREVRNFFELAVSNQANRLASDPDLSDEELITLTIEDVRC